MTHDKVPMLPSNFATKTSRLVAFMLMPPKSVSPLNSPVTNKSPIMSTAKAPTSLNSPVPFTSVEKLVAHIQLPIGSALATNPS